MMNKFEYNRSILESLKSFNLLEKKRYEAENGTTHQDLSDNTTEVVLELAKRFNGNVPELSVTRPSLEDIYLTMIEGQQ